MRTIDETNVCHYLRETGRIPADAPLRARRLAGGVSNEVLLVEAVDAGGPRMVVKQARERLRVADDWRCTVERIWRETETLRLCQRFATPGQTPALLFEDRDHYLFAMSAAPAGHHVWRDDLLRGQFDSQVATAAGALLAALHAGGWHNDEVAERLADRAIFWQLRIEPYYQTVAQRHPGDAAFFSLLTDSLDAHCCSLVHADYSPKNLLVHDGQIMLVDYETGHWGDPAFDIGFFLSHLVLKAFYHAPSSAPMLALVADFWAAYAAALRPAISNGDYAALVARGVQNLAGCLWARLDGKSPVDYLAGESRRGAVRRLARRVLVDEVATWPEFAELLAIELEPICAKTAS
jgi:5-methylthioribose kinase